MPKLRHTAVTLVTPVYNQENYISATIESVLGQDYPNLEYIVLDDGSTDGTCTQIQKYATRCVCDRHENVGQALTLNRGWARSKGEYIGYLSADDILLPDAISLLAKALDENPDVVVVYGDYDLMDSSGQTTEHQRSNDFSLAEMTEHLICHPGVGVLFRRAVFEQTGGWNPKLRKIPDFEFWLRASQFGPFLRVPRTIGQYRVHEESTSIRPVPTSQSMEIVQAMQEYWADRDGTLEARRGLSRAHYVAARSHAQSGRLLASMGEFRHAIQYRPGLLFSRSSWRKYIGSLLLRYFNRFDRISRHLR
jgi:glycosyltransferase involved in cell wall biosynthesis